MRKKKKKENGGPPGKKTKTKSDKKRLFQTDFGRTNPHNKAKTEAKQHQEASTEHKRQNQKFAPESSLHARPKNWTIFSDSFRGQRHATEQKLGETSQKKHRQNT